MARSAVAICNRALGHLGVTRRIARLSDDTKEAEVFSREYDEVRDDALSLADWYFARRRVELEADSATVPDEWTYAHSLPTDCIIPRFIADGLKVRRHEQRVTFTIENIAGGNERLVVFSDTEEPTLVYTRRITNSIFYPAWFTSFLAWHLAATLATDLVSVTTKLEMRVEERARVALGVAISANFSAEQTAPEPVSELESIRT